MKFPDEFLRGITQKEQIGDNGFPSSSLFLFQDRKSQEKRADKYLEESINWRDGKGAEDTLFNQERDDGRVQFRFGAAVVCRRELDRVIVKPVVNRQLSYERKKIPENPYHGNLLLNKDVQKRVRNQIAATIAIMCVKEIIPNPNAV